MLVYFSPCGGSHRVARVQISGKASELNFSIQKTGFSRLLILVPRRRRKQIFPNHQNPMGKCTNAHPCVFRPLPVPALYLCRCSPSSHSSLPRTLPSPRGPSSPSRDCGVRPRGAAEVALRSFSIRCGVRLRWLRRGRTRALRVLKQITDCNIA